ncbi:solute carrier family 35 member C2-like [Pollicipes pollicipes]|uniref:solute carrier family 35 member C2-like n=1 Tax=Pollicipes pollicipes TaxID=41117 RepID=UPI001885675E|nr:solute carrier family 35 member C2-like [Pollicipes pollicipes]XP_037077631.1 solute carrier family 35 member C2-like [Pollicipes pollicipes]XP_037077632.1 solute carrier family 35 member C2-like [Pollicipes pollicipes]XP_037077633.1 solute carrier family 35 member C2-like [Pollicipes pollicipes]
MVKNIMDFELMKYAFKSIGCLLTYFFFSISLTFYQKSLLQELRFPLSIVLAHLTVKFLLAATVRNYLECTYNTQRTTLSWRQFWRKMSAPGVLSALDIGLSQWSFEFITVTLYTMTKSTSVIFIYVCALFLRIEQLQWSMALVVTLISGGLVIFTYESTTFHLLGFLMALAAALSSGLRWTLSQILMQKKELGLSNPIDMIYHIQPWMIVSLMPFAVFFEGAAVATSRDLFLYSEPHQLADSAGRVLLGCVLAFMMDLSEFLALRVTSSVTLCVASVFKEVCTLLLAILVNGDELSGLKAVGLVTCVGGIALHAGIKARHLATARPVDVRPRHLGTELPLLGEHDDDDDDEDVLFENR